MVELKTENAGALAEEMEYALYQLDAFDALQHEMLRAGAQGCDPQTVECLAVTFSAVLAEIKARLLKAGEM